jgi:hypothetical protein
MPTTTTALGRTGSLELSRGISQHGRESCIVDRRFVGAVLEQLIALQFTSPFGRSFRASSTARRPRPAPALTRGGSSNPFSNVRTANPEAQFDIPAAAAISV